MDACAFRIAHVEGQLSSNTVSRQNKSDNLYTCCAYVNEKNAFFKQFRHTTTARYCESFGGLLSGVFKYSHFVRIATKQPERGKTKTNFHFYIKVQTNLARDRSACDAMTMY